MAGHGRRRSLQVWWLILWANIMLLHGYFEQRDGDSRKTRGVVSGQALASAPGVNLLIGNRQVVLQNGIVNLTLSTPKGRVIGVSYNGVQNLLETQHHEKHRGYWDLVWGRKESIDVLEGTNCNVVKQTEDQVEISFTRKWNVSFPGKKAPLNVDKRYVMLRGSSGFYTYTVLDRLTGWPDFDLKQLRVVFKLQSNKFRYLAISDKKQRMMPMPIDRQRGRKLDYSEAVLLTKPVNPQFKGEVDDKYFYSVNNIDNRVYGWVRNDPSVGFWMITPSNEFRTGGPFKQDLTTHVGPNLLNMFVSLHYAGDDLALKFRKGEPWKKVFGPVFVYLNSDIEARNKPASLLWEDAKQQMFKEVAKWPYAFPYSPDFVHADQRGSVSGQILVHDWFTNKKPVPGSYAYVGLAPPGAAGSWQRESKGYQFWTKSDRYGSFVIEGVIKGNYSLYAWVPGTIGDYKYDQDVVISPGLKINLGRFVYRPPRNGTTLWEIGIADRKASEFYVPTPSFKVNEYYHGTVHGVGSIFTDRFRQYGLWKRYRDLYPLSDLVYKIGASNYTRDWFFAHVTRCNGRRHIKCVPTTWQIVFDLQSLRRASTYTLQIALASANYAELEVRFNSRNATKPHFTTGLIGRDNAVARHGSHGLYRLYSVDVAGNLLVEGRNTIYLKQSRAADQFREVMYDYIRLEGPGSDPHELLGLDLGLWM